MSSTDVIAAAVHDACPRCGALALQRWETARGRPTVSWSRCVRCDSIAVWERGQLEHPPLGAAASAAALDATRAESAAQREQLVAALRDRYDALAGERAAAAAAAAFVARYQRYSADRTLAAAEPGAPERADDMSRAAQGPHAGAPLNTDRTSA